jgi:hypothetical protein
MKVHGNKPSSGMLMHHDDLLAIHCRIVMNNIPSVKDRKELSRVGTSVSRRQALRVSNKGRCEIIGA